MLSAMKTTERRSLAAEDLDLARQIGLRLKAARLRSGMTQRQVAEGRYTKAYVSALENGLIKPSMAALRFLATRLGTTASELLTDHDLQWARIEAELRLASGDWQAAADAYDILLTTTLSGVERGRIQLGRAEALYRLGRAPEAIRVASEAAERLTVAGLLDEARYATYWLAAAHHRADNPAQARLLLEDLLAQAKGTNRIGPDLHVRLLVALATVLTHAGEARRALLLLEEARGIGADLDDRRRAALLSSLALGYRATGDMEAAVRAGIQGLALYRSAEAVAEAASVGNELALIYLEIGNIQMASSHVADARREFERLRDDFWLAHIGDTEAQIALASGDLDGAAKRAAAAAGLARATGNETAEVTALLTEARAARRSGDVVRAADILATATGLARGGPRPRLREILSEWSELLADAGDHARAYELSREALALV